jgi:hypothetical protein
VEQGCAIIDAEHMYKLPNIPNYNLEVKTGERKPMGHV